MAEDRIPPSDPNAEHLEIARQVRPLDGHETRRTLASELGETVDDIRQLYTDVGIRPYRVFLVHVQWSGDRVGIGDIVEISRREILPTPRIRDMSAVSQLLAPTGLQEEGSAVIDQISTKFAEDDLMGRTPDLQDPALQRTSRSRVQFFWEVIEQRRTSPAPVHRRFVPATAPALSKDGFQWSVSMTRQDFDPSREGTHTPRETF